MLGAGVFYPASPTEIRDGTAARLATVEGFKKVFKTRTIPTKDEHLPFAAVWHAGERTEPNGDANVGAPSFVHTLTLVVDVVALANTDEEVEDLIVGLVETTRATLLTDYTWINLFEGIERCDTRYAYPKETTDRIVQAMIEIEVTIRSEWPPFVPNDFETVVVDTTAPDEISGPFEGYATQFDIPEPSS